MGGKEETNRLLLRSLYVQLVPIIIIKCLLYSMLDVWGRGCSPFNITTNFYIHKNRAIYND